MFLSSRVAFYLLLVSLSHSSLFLFRVQFFLSSSALHFYNAFTHAYTNTHTHRHSLSINAAAANLTKITAIIFYATTTAATCNNGGAQKPCTQSTSTFRSFFHSLYLLYTIVGIIIIVGVIFALPCTK